MASYLDNKAGGCCKTWQIATTVVGMLPVASANLQAPKALVPDIAGNVPTFQANRQDLQRPTVNFAP